METINFKNKKVTVMGIGLHGGAVAMIKWLSKQGARVIATDMKSKEELKPSLDKLANLKNVTIVAGQHRMEDFERVDMVIINPAVRWDNKYVKAAIAKKVPVEMDASLFFKLCPSKKTIGITGTKGKTTTSTLIFELLLAAGKSVIKVGIGQEAVMNKLSLIDKDTYVVFELSSWRLGALGRAKISPHIAVVTNIYQDHLNYYPSMKEYINDKKNIYRHQKKGDFLIINGDNEETRKMLEEAKGTALGCYRVDITKQSDGKWFASPSVKDFEADGVYEMIDHISYKLGGRTGDICHASDLELKGAHNVYNVMAAAAVGMVLGIKPEVMAPALVHFKGNPHRLEFVRELNKVRFYNDTAATTPESGIVGIHAFSEPVHLICGGSNKNLDLAPFAREIANTPSIEKIYLLQGAATDGRRKLVEQAGGADKIVGTYDSMESAVEAAYEIARQNLSCILAKSRTVLLSPGCASFGMFQNEFHRGDTFIAAVKELK